MRLFHEIQKNRLEEIWASGIKVGQAGSKRDTQINRTAEL